MVDKTVENVTDAVTIIEQHKENADLVLSLLVFGSAAFMEQINVTPEMETKIGRIVSDASKQASLLAGFVANAHKRADEMLGLDPEL